MATFLLREETAPNEIWTELIENNMNANKANKDGFWNQGAMAGAKCREHPEQATQTKWRVEVLYGSWSYQEYESWHDGYKKFKERKNY